jgi:hypothetical protein
MFCLECCGTFPKISLGSSISNRVGFVNPIKNHCWLSMTGRYDHKLGGEGEKTNWAAIQQIPKISLDNTKYCGKFWIKSIYCYRWGDFFPWQMTISHCRSFKKKPNKALCELWGLEEQTKFLKKQSPRNYWHSSLGFSWGECATPFVSFLTKKHVSQVGFFVKKKMVASVNPQIHRKRGYFFMRTPGIWIRVRYSVDSQA